MEWNGFMQRVQYRLVQRHRADSMLDFAKRVCLDKFLPFQSDPLLSFPMMFTFLECCAGTMSGYKDAFVTFPRINWEI